jgi:hypothetical protein
MEAISSICNLRMCHAMVTETHIIGITVLRHTKITVSGKEREAVYT